MPLEKQTIVIPAGASGANLSGDPRLASGITRVENAEWILDNLISKRIGSSPLVETPDPPSYSDDDFIASYRGEAIRFGTSGNVAAADASYSYAQATLRMLDVGIDGIAQSDHDAYYYCSVAQSATIRAVAYTTRQISGGVATYSVVLNTFDLSSGARKDSRVCGSGYTVPRYARVLLVAGALYYYWFDDSKHLYGGVIDQYGSTNSPTQITAANDALATCVEWDACVLEVSGSYVMICYAGDATGRLCVLSLPAGWTSGATCVDIDAGAATYAVSKPAIWRQTNGLATYACVLDHTTWRLVCGIRRFDTTEDVATFEIDTAVKATWTPHSVCGALTSSTAGNCYWSMVDANATPKVRLASYSTGGAGSAADFAQRSRVAFKPLILPGEGLCIVPLYSRSWNYALGAQDSIYLMLRGVVVGKMLLGSARLGDGYGHLSGIQILTSASSPYIPGSSWLTSIMRLIALDNSVDNKDVYQIQVATISDLTSVCVATEAGPERLLIPSSSPYEIAGTEVVEHGFTAYPEPFAVVATTSGGSMADGTYRYRLCYEWTDSNGARHSSAPSPEAAVVVVSGGSGAAKVTVTCPTLALTSKPKVMIAVFRTVASGTDYYRVGAVDNSITAQTVSFVDTQPDSFIVDMDTLYTDSGEIENTQPKQHRTSCIWGTRHFAVDREAESTDIYYSKSFGARVPVNHSDLQLIRCSPLGGRITALAGFVDKLIIFKSTALYASDGSGYDATLGGSNYSDPWLINPSVGCADPRCVALTPMGVAFLGSDGHVWILDHSMQCAPISDPVHHWLNVLAPVAFVTEPARRLLHVFTEGVDLVYNWEVKRWSTWTGRAAVQACAVDGVAHWLAVSVDASSVAMRDDDAEWTDSDVRYATVVETALLSAGGLGGMQRIYRILIVGYNIASHGLRVKLAYDGDPTWVDSALFSAAPLSTFDVSAHFGDGLGESYHGQAYCIEVFPSRPCCSSIRVHVSDESGTGNTWSLAAIAFVVGSKPGKMQRVDRARVI